MYKIIQIKTHKLKHKIQLHFYSLTMKTMKNQVCKNFIYTQSERIKLLGIN